MQQLFDSIQTSCEEGSGVDVDMILKPLCERIAGFTGIIESCGLSTDREGKISIVELRLQSFTVPTLLMRFRFDRETGITIVSCIEKDATGKVQRCLCKEEMAAALKRIPDIHNELGI